MAESGSAIADAAGPGLVTIRQMLKKPEYSPGFAGAVVDDDAAGGLAAGGGPDGAETALASAAAPILISHDQRRTKSPPDARWDRDFNEHLVSGGRSSTAHCLDRRPESAKTQSFKAPGAGTK